MSQAQNLRLIQGNPKAPFAKNWHATRWLCLHCLDVTVQVYPAMWQHLAANEPCPKCGGWLAQALTKSAEI